MSSLSKSFLCLGQRQSWANRLGKQVVTALHEAAQRVLDLGLEHTCAHGSLATSRRGSRDRNSSQPSANRTREHFCRSALPFCLSSHPLVKTFQFSLDGKPRSPFPSLFVLLRTNMFSAFRAVASGAAARIFESVVCVVYGGKVSNCWSACHSQGIGHSISHSQASGIGRNLPAGLGLSRDFPGLPGLVLLAFLGPSGVCASARFTPAPRDL